MTQATIAFLGTGLMGAPMARNLLAAGFTVQVWNRSIAKAVPLAGYGARVCSSPEAAVTGADFVITTLSNGTATESIMGSAAVAAALKSGATWIEMSSVKPTEARWQRDHLQELGVAHLDAPISGGTRGAETGSLAIMVGGEVAVFEPAVPVLQAMGRPVLVGPSGSGQLAKLANQAIVGVTIGAVAEAMLLLEEGGADPAAVRLALKGGFADSTILQQHGERMTKRNFDPGGASRTQVKDLDNLLEEAASLKLDLPMSKEVRRRFARFCDEMEGGDRDHSGLYLELRKHNNMKDAGK